MLDVIGIGMPYYDNLFHVQSLPKHNETVELKSQSRQGGGKVATALIALARQGVSCGAMMVIGADDEGQFVYDDFMRHGIDVSHSQRNGLNAFSIVCSDAETGSRTIILRKSTGKFVLSEADLAYCEQARYLHLENGDAVSREAAKRLRKAGGRVVMDGDGYADAIQAMMGDIDVFIGSEFYYESLFGKSVDYEKNMAQVGKLGPSQVIFTFGERGCRYYGNNEYIEAPAFSVEVVDSVGAGDVFHGAYIAALIKDMKPKDALVWASATAAIKCTRIGGRAAIPDAQTVRTYIDTGIIDFTQIDRRVAFYGGEGDFA